METIHGLYGSIELLGKCDLACEGCYETRHDKSLKLPPRPSWSLLPLDVSKHALYNLKQSGFSQVNLEGGEPTLFRTQDQIDNALEELIKVGKSLGLKMIVSTHGMSLMNETPPRAEKFMVAGLDCLSLSLDGATAEIDNQIRVNHSGKPSQHFLKALLFLQWYSKQVKREVSDLYDLKINCVVQKSNLKDLEQIGKLVSLLIGESEKVSIKLVQMQPRGRARENFDKLTVSTADVDNLAETIKASCSYKVITRSYDGNEYPFFVFTPAGFGVIPEGEIHRPVIVDGKPLDLRSSDFSSNLRRFCEERPDFESENKAINSYL